MQHLLCLIIQIYWIVIIVRIVFSFLPDLVETSPIFSAIQTAAYAATEPVFATVRKGMPRLGDLPIDLSPIVIFLVLGLLRSIVC